MGKNSDRKSLIRGIVNTVVHKIVFEHTNRQESKSSLNSEIVEYHERTQDIAKEHKWNEEDIRIIKEKSLEEINKKLSSKYGDVQFSIEDIPNLLDKEIGNLGL